MIWNIFVKSSRPYQPTQEQEDAIAEINFRILLASNIQVPAQISVISGYIEVVTEAVQNVTYHLKFTKGVVLSVKRTINMYICP